MGQDLKDLVMDDFAWDARCWCCFVGHRDERYVTVALPSPDPEQSVQHDGLRARLRPREIFARSHVVRANWKGAVAASMN